MTKWRFLVWACRLDDKYPPRPQGDPQAAQKETMSASTKKVKKVTRSKKSDGGGIETTTETTTTTTSSTEGGSTVTEINYNNETEAAPRSVK